MKDKAKFAVSDKYSVSTFVVYSNFCAGVGDLRAWLSSDWTLESHGASLRVSLRASLDTPDDGVPHSSGDLLRPDASTEWEGSFRQFLAQDDGALLAVARHFRFELKCSLIQPRAFLNKSPVCAMFLRFVCGGGVRTLFALLSGKLIERSIDDLQA